MTQRTQKGRQAFWAFRSPAPPASRPSLTILKRYDF